MTSTEIQEQIEVLNVRRSRIQSDLDQANTMLAQSRDEVVSVGGREELVDAAAAVQSRHTFLVETLSGLDESIGRLSAQQLTVEAEEQRSAEFDRMVQIANAATANLNSLEQDKQALNNALKKHVASLIKHRAALIECRGQFLSIAGRHAPIQYSAIRMLTPQGENAIADLIERLEDMGADLSAVRNPWGTGRTEIDQEFKSPQLEFGNLIVSLMLQEIREAA